MAMSLRQKLQILSRIPVQGKNKARAGELIKAIEKFKKIRDVLAHSTQPTTTVVNNLYDNNELRRILSDYPSSYKNKLENLNRKFTAVWNTYIGRENC